MLGALFGVWLAASLRVLAGHHHHVGLHAYENEQVVLGAERGVGKRVAVIGELYFS
jgi:hypothetical protein